MAQLSEPQNWTKLPRLIDYARERREDVAHGPTARGITPNLSQRARRQHSYVHPSERQDGSAMPRSSSPIDVGHRSSVRCSFRRPNRRPRRSSLRTQREIPNSIRHLSALCAVPDGTCDVRRSTATADEFRSGSHAGGALALEDVLSLSQAFKEHDAPDRNRSARRANEGLMRDCGDLRDRMLLQRCVARENALNDAAASGVVSSFNGGAHRSRAAAQTRPRNGDRYGDCLTRSHSHTVLNRRDRIGVRYYKCPGERKKPELMALASALILVGNKRVSTENIGGIPRPVWIADKPAS